MSRQHLRPLRILVAAIVLIATTIALADFRGMVPTSVAHWFTSVQFVPAMVAATSGMVASIIIAAAIVVITLLIGRIYCSAICPLGIFQDVVSRVSRMVRGKKYFLPYKRAVPFIRQGFLWLTFAGIIVGWSGFTLALTDPYSNYGRIASTLFRPLLTIVNNAITGIANAAGISAVYRVEIHWAAVGAIAIPAAFLTIVIIMAALRGRLYCNSFCPVGTFLGMLSKRAAFRIAINQSACRKCGQCLRTCKAQCIDLKSGTIDASRCIACYDCISVCDDNGIGYQFSWGSSKSAPSPANASGHTGAHSTSPDSQGRRAFISGTATAITAVTGTAALLAIAGQESAHKHGDKNGGQGTDDEADDNFLHEGEPNQSKVICPPGSAGVSRFLDRCTSCQLCISACPTGVLQPALMQYGLEGLLKPHLDFTASFCNFDCHRCAEVCPDGAISVLDLAVKQTTQLGVAHFLRRLCIVKTNGTDCAACSEHCPTKAVYTIPFRDNLRIPKVNPDLCIGCGACEYACPAKPEKAIVVKGRLTHLTAKRLVEEKPAAQAPGADFPF